MSDPAPLRDILPAVLEQIETAYLNTQAPHTGAFACPRRQP